jgi:hypothetical protein
MGYSTLPGQMSESVVLWDRIGIVLRRIAKGAMGLTRAEHHPNQSSADEPGVWKTGRLHGPVTVGR